MTRALVAALAAAVLLAWSFGTSAIAATAGGHAADPAGDSRDGMSTDDLVAGSVGLDSATGDWTITTQLAAAPSYDERTRLTALLWSPQSDGTTCADSGSKSPVARVVSDTAAPSTEPGASKVGWTIFDPGTGSTIRSGADGVKAVQDGGRTVTVSVHTGALVLGTTACATIQLGLNGQRDQLDSPILITSGAAGAPAAPKPAVRPLSVPSLQNDRVLFRDKHYGVHVRLQRLPERVAAVFELRRPARNGGRLLGRAARRIVARQASTTTISLNADARRLLRKSGGRSAARLVVSFTSGSRSARRTVAVTLRSAPTWTRTHR